MSYIGRGLEVGSMRQLDDISSSFDGSTTAFTMQINSVNVDQSVVGDVNQLVLSLGGVIQEPGTDFTVSGSTLTFTTAPAANTNFFCIIYGGGGGFATPGDKTVTESKFNILDGKSIKFGTDDEIELTHNADKGLILKHTATADDKPVSLTLQTGETDIAQDDVIGKIEFQAPDEGTGTDAILVAAGIQAVSEGDFSSSSNATGLQFLTGNSAAATAKMVLTSGGSGNEGRLGVGTTHPASGAGLDAFIEVQGGDPGIVLRDDTASDAVELYGAGGTFVVYTGSADALKIDSTGAVTKPLQPAFMAIPSGVQSNVSDLTVLEFATEVFDQNADWNNSNHTFTAPVTGRYQVSCIIRIDENDLDGSYYGLHVATSNRDYYNLWGTRQFDADPQYHPFAISLLIDMDAADTLQFKYAESSSEAAQADVSTASYVAVYLVC